MSDQGEYTCDVFISSSPTDRVWVHEALLPRLQVADLRVDVSESGEDVDAIGMAELERRIRQARHVVAVLSPNALINRRTIFERDLAQSLDLQEGTFRLLLVRVAPLDERQLPARLAMLSAADFTRPDQVERMFRKVVQVLQGPMLNQAMVQETQQHLPVGEQRGVVGQVLAWLRRLGGR